MKRVQIEKGVGVGGADGAWEGGCGGGFGWRGGGR